MLDRIMKLGSIKWLAEGWTIPVRSPPEVKNQLHEADRLATGETTSLISNRCRIDSTNTLLETAASQLLQFTEGAAPGWLNKMGCRIHVNYTNNVGKGWESAVLYGPSICTMRCKLVHQCVSEFQFNKMRIITGLLQEGFLHWWYIKVTDTTAYNYVLLTQCRELHR